MINLDNVDAWALRGFSGLKKLLMERIRLPEAMSPANLQLLRMYEQQIADIVTTFDSRAYIESENLRPASSAGVDHWLLSGFDGLFTMLEDRLKDGKLNQNNLDTLHRIHQRMGGILVSHNQDAGRSVEM